jgi:hypothetical protein
MMSEENQTSGPLQPRQEGERLPQLPFEQRALQAIEANPKKACTALIPLFNENGVRIEEKKAAIISAIKTLTSGMSTRKLEVGDISRLRQQAKILFGLDGSQGTEPEWVVNACRTLLEENSADFYAFAKIFNFRQLDQLSSLLEDFDANHLSRYLQNALGQLSHATRLLRQGEIHNQRFFETLQNQASPIRSWVTTLLDQIATSAEEAAEEEGDPDVFLRRVAESMWSRTRGSDNLIQTLEYVVEIEIDDTLVAEKLLTLLSSMEK